MKRILVLAATLLLLLYSLSIAAQTTAVTATVTDSQSVTWINAPYTVKWSGEGHPSTTSGQFFTTSFSGTTNASGQLSLTVTDVAYIVPINSKWQVCVAPATSSSTNWCVDIAITGASENISSQIAGIIQPPVITGAPLAKAYADSEVTGTPGNLYFRLSDQEFRCYTYGWGSCVGITDSSTDPTGVACTSAAPILRYTSGGVSQMFSCTGSGGSVYAAMVGGYPGVTSDGANGLNVSGTVAAGTGVSTPSLTLNGVTETAWPTGSSIEVPTGFPQQLLGFTGDYNPVLTHDANAWDANGLGAPSTPVYINGKWGVCMSGYPTASLSSGQDVGCALSSNLANGWTMYVGNPVITNTSPSWATTCLEGSKLTQHNGTVYNVIAGYSGVCDGMADGLTSIQIMTTTETNFPAGWGALPSTPTISLPISGLHWLYQGEVKVFNSTCYLYFNGGNASDQMILGVFTAPLTAGVCPTAAGTWTYGGQLLTDDQAWQGSGELQNPDVFQTPSGLYVMHYSVYGAIGYATSQYPDHGFIDLPVNPIYSAVVGDTNLGAVFADASGQYWRLSGANNTSMWVSKAVGIYGNFSPLLSTSLHPPSSSYPIWTTSIGNDGCLQLLSQQPSGNQLANGVSNFEDCAGVVNISSQSANPGLGMTMYAPNLAGANAHTMFWMGKGLNADSGGFGWNYDATGTIDFLDFETYGGAKPIRFATSNFNIDPIAHTASFSDPVSVNGGANVVYRCTVAGTLRVGQTTTVSADCGTAVDTGLRVQ